MHNSWDKFHIQSQYIHVFKIYPIFLSKPLTLRLCMPANNIDVTSEYPVRAICQEINSLFSRVVTRTVAYLLYDYLHTRRNIFSLFFFICLSNIYSITSFLLYLNWYIFFFYRGFYFTSSCSYWYLNAKYLHLQMQVCEFIFRMNKLNYTSIHYF